jgi:hypothetical protein
MGIARILEAIYEGDFLDFSYGFRPGKNGHQAIGQLHTVIITKLINHVIDGHQGIFRQRVPYLDAEVLGHRINDPNLYA